jgi:ribosomal protein S12 methylthiotransferase accessory factor YcaO
LGLRVRELDQTRAYNNATSAARGATARAALLKAKGEAIEKLMMNPQFREQYEMSLKKGHPSQAQAKAYVDQIIQQQIGDIDFTGLNDENDGGMTITPYAGT